MNLVHSIVGIAKNVPTVIPTIFPLFVRPGSGASKPGTRLLQQLLFSPKPAANQLAVIIVLGLLCAPTISFVWALGWSLLQHQKYLNRPLTFVPWEPQSFLAC